MRAEATAQHVDAEVHLSDVLQRIDTLLGLRYQPHQSSDLLRLLKPAARELGYADLSGFLAYLVRGDQDEITVNVLAKHLTIGESYFFREIVAFSILREHILPEMIDRKRAQGDRALRVWSAGCSTGEEVYSLAILLDSFVNDLPDWSCTVLGTDVNPVAVERAREGLYRDWSFRDVPLEIHSAYFERTEDGKHAISDRIRRRTEFRVLNLVTAPALYPSGFDLIFCRNVLLYFTREKVNSVVQGFRRSLRENGWLVPSLTETTLINNPGFEGVRFGDATLYRKQPPVPRILSLRQAASAAEAAEGGNTATEGTPADTAEQAAEQAAERVASSRGLRNPFEGLISPNSRTETNDAGAARHSFTADAATGGQTDIEMRERPLRRDMPGIPEADVQPAGSPATGVDVHEFVLEARRHADAGNLEAALTAARAAITRNKMEPQAHFMLGTILRESGETSQALQAFDRALYLNQDFIPAHFSIGTLYSQLGQDARARRHFGIALHLLETQGDMDILLEPGDISARHMADIIRTFLER